MFKAIIPAGTILADNVNIPLTVKLNTNKDTRYNSSINAVEILTPGYYDLKVSLPLTDASDGSLILQGFTNGRQIDEMAAWNDITATTGITQFTIVDVIRVVPNAPGGQVANVSVRINGGTAELVGDGVFILERRR